MKKLLSLLLLAACLISLASCGGGGDIDPSVTGGDVTTGGMTTLPPGGIPTPGTPSISTDEQYHATYYMPSPMLTAAPTSLLLDWDIKSVRNPYANTVNAGDGTTWKRDYSMPVYRFDTYEEFLHLEAIIGKGLYPTVSPFIDEHLHTVQYFDYREGTFDGYSLLLGWFNIETPHTLDCYNTNVSPKVVGDDLLLTVSGGDTCACTPDSERAPVSGLIWIAVPKAELAECDGIAFILKNCLVADTAD